MTWLRRIGGWLLIALAALVPAWGWLRERHARKAAEQRWHDEVARGQREAALARDRMRIQREAHDRGARVRTEAESRAVAHETRATDALALEDDLDALAAELDRTAR